MQILNRQVVTQALPIRERDIYKQRLGHVLCIGGNQAMGGAIILAAQAALNSGAGLITVASDSLNVHALHSRIPEAMFCAYENRTALKQLLTQVNTVLLGPGLGRDDQAQQIYDFVLTHIPSDKALIIDADGLYLLSQQSHWHLPPFTILTPHLGEWRYLCQNRIKVTDTTSIMQWTTQHRVTLVLKQARTCIFVGQQAWRNDAGNPAMATGGMGDCLAGMIAGFIGQYQDKTMGLLSAVYCHSAIADELATSYYSVPPSLLIDHIGQFMAGIQNEKQLG